MKFKIDENLSPRVAALFRAAGLDAITVDEQGHAGIDDKALWSVCTSERRILVTMDRRFLDARTYAGRSSPGCVVLRLREESRIGQLAAASRVLHELEAKSPAGHIWIATETRVRSG